MNKLLIKRFLIVSLFLLPTLAMADDLNLKVSQPEAELIWKGLRKLSVEEVEPLMAKIKQQVMEQTSPKPSASGQAVSEGKPEKK